MKIISLSIDVTKIDKERLYRGKKGTYLNANVVLKDEKDSYGNDGFVSEKISQEERESGVKGAILGNAKIVFDSDDEKKPEEQVFTDDIPF